MSFHKENIPAFLENFNLMKDKIRNAKGNRFLELYQDKNDACIFFTYSYWETVDDLDAKPEAWSVDKLVSLQ